MRVRGDAQPGKMQREREGGRRQGHLRQTACGATGLLQVHERSVEIDLLLLLLRDVLARRASTAAAAAAGRPAGSSACPVPLKLVLMSATADAELFCRYMQQRPGAQPGPAPAVSAAGDTGSSGRGRGGAGGGRAGPGGAGGGALQLAAGAPLEQPQQQQQQVGMLSIPGFTYPVREFYLEDVFEMTGGWVDRRACRFSKLFLNTNPAS